MLHHLSQQPDTTATASLTTELLHASFVVASSSAAAVCDRGMSLTNAVNAITNKDITHRPRTTTCVAFPRMSSSSLAVLEYSVHVSPRRLARDLGTVFPGRDLSNLLVVPTFQKCKNEMVAWDAEIAKEKDDRLDDFIRWSKAIHARLERLGFWSDMTDPASGFPSFSERGRDVYPDVEGCQMLLKYDFQNAGCCKILLHPIWGSKIYPATFFTTAPQDVLLRVIAQVEQEYSTSL